MERELLLFLDKVEGTFGSMAGRLVTLKNLSTPMLGRGLSAGLPPWSLPYFERLDGLDMVSV